MSRYVFVRVSLWEIYSRNMFICMLVYESICVRVFLCLFHGGLLRYESYQRIYSLFQRFLCMEYQKHVYHHVQSVHNKYLWSVLCLQCFP